MTIRLASVCALALVLSTLAPAPITSAQVTGTDVTYTTDADFDLGTLVSVNHDAPYNDQLQLDSPIEPFPFINVAASGRGTVVRANTETGEIVGEYRTAPEGRGLNPSRTTVDLFGNVWTANRDEVDEIDGVPHGSVVKIGLVVGGTRADADGTPDPGGDYLAPPFGYNTCSDRDGDGLIRTSAGLGDILDWPDVTDGLGGGYGLVEDAADECLLIYQRLPDAEQARHVSVDADNNVWVGGYPFETRMFYKLDGATGTILDSFDARTFGCGGYGGLIDGNGVLWSIGWDWAEGTLLRYDPAEHTGTCVNTYGGYGLGIDTNGYVWASIWNNGIAKVSPDGTLQAGYPKSTYPMTSTSTATGSMAPLVMETRPTLALPAVLAAADTPTFWAAPGDDWVGSMNPWSPGAAISLTIEDGSGVVYADAQSADTDGNFHFGFGGAFDLQRGHVVTVSDGTTTKTHTVQDLFVDGVDLAADTVFGRAGPGSSVDVWVHGDGSLTVTADGSGNWTADFSGMTDLTYLSDGGSAQSDTDGDATGVWWAPPRFQAAPQDNWIGSGGNWTPGATISLTIEDGSGVVYTDTQSADAEGYFHFEFGEMFDLQRGHVVTVSDATTTKTHIVTNLFADGVDVTADTIFGRADAGSDIDVWVHGDGNLGVTADGSGNWVADFSGMTDLTYLSDGGSAQYDTDGDGTFVWWASPRFQVAPDDNWVQSYTRWTPGATISLTIEDGSGVVYSDSQTADVDGNFHFGFGELFDLRRGHVVTVSDGTNTKTHTVRDLFVDGVDVTGDTVFGRADPGTDVNVWVHGDGWLTTTADGSGNWVADFSGITDLTYRSDGGSQQFDTDGDSTGVWWASPRFQANPDHNWVASTTRWIPGATISLTIEDGSGVIYSDSQVADGAGNFHFDLGEGFDLQRGHVVTVSDGTTTKTHTVIDLYADSVDFAADTVMGRAPAGTTVYVWIHGTGIGTSAAVDESGNWTADFSGLFDLTALSEGGAEQSDDDGDSTAVEWSTPRFGLNPDDDWVSSVTRWTAGSTISMTVEDGSGVVYSDSQTADSDGNFHFGLGGVFDLQRGHVVTVSDGTTTKSHTVRDLFITSVDADADVVYGTAGSGSEVEVYAHEAGIEVRVTVTADGAGNWNADFSSSVDLLPTSDVNAVQTDDEGDSTVVPWNLPVFRVAPDDESLWGWGWSPGTELAISISGGDPSPYATTVMTDLWGGFWLALSAFDIEPGEIVTVSDGTTTKTHTVRDVNATPDHSLDTVGGTAAPFAWVWVNVYVFENDSAWRSVQADGSGSWLADFSIPSDGEPAFDITEAAFIDVEEFDDDGDATSRTFGPPIQANRGVAVTPADNHVWVANSGVDTVTRLDNDGNIIKVIETGDEPTGVAVDAAGKVWVTNLGSDNAVRIDPDAGSDGLGAVDLAVDLGPGASPYNYSDMTGAVVVGSTSPQGFWTVVQDSGEPGFAWGRITWNTEPEAYEPPGAEIVVEVRTADTEAGLGGATFAPVPNGELLSSFGRYLEVRVTLKAGPDGASPVLSDIRVQPAVIEVDIDIKPGSYPNSINIGRTTGVVPVAVLGSAEFDVTTIDIGTLRFGPAEAPPTHDLSNPLTYLDHLEDVNEDGYMDLVSHYTVGAIGLSHGDVEACLTGATLEGIPIEGCDSVRILGKG